MTLLFCHHCGEKLLEGSSFCNTCGSKVEPVQEATTQPEEHVPEQPIVSNEKQPQPTNIKPSPPISQHTYQPEQSPKKESTFKSILPFLVPLLSLVIVTVVLVISFTTEQKKNNTVLELQKSGESEALAGNYDAAIKAVDEAIKLRPDYEILQLNLEETNKAKEFSAQLDSVSKSISSQDFAGAEQLLATLKEQVNTNNGPLFANFQANITKEEERISIGKLIQEVASINTIDELASKLSELESLSSPEAESVRSEILDKIAQITNTEATDFLANGQFAEALNVVNKGLSYKTDDEELLQLKEKIEQEKVAMEEQAAEEDLHNRTAAVELLTFTANLEDNGDISIEGTIKSNATIPIYTIVLYYAVYDTNGEFLLEGSVNVEPNQLEPGDEGTFAAIISGVDQEATVEMYHATWYFDE
jgi:tetratricopeptide (TPR) repeat protein